jgi:hypothetical protein
MITKAESHYALLMGQIATDVLFGPFDRIARCVTDQPSAHGDTRDTAALLLVWPPLWANWKLSEFESCYDRRSVGLGAEPYLGLMTKCYVLLDSFGFVKVGRSL